MSSPVLSPGESRLGVSQGGGWSWCEVRPGGHGRGHARHGGEHIAMGGGAGQPGLGQDPSQVPEHEQVL